MTHICNPSYLGDWDQEDNGSRLAWANSSWDPHLQNNQSEMDWRCGSIDRVSALQFKLQSHQKTKKLLTGKEWLSTLLSDRALA
jgi:hypothetical protein